MMGRVVFEAGGWWRGRAGGVNSVVAIDRVSGI